MQPFERHIKINYDHMHYLYQKDERALPGNLQNGKYSFLSPQITWVPANKTIPFLSLSPNKLSVNEYQEPG
jgi:hypothetical protein